MDLLCLRSDCRFALVVIKRKWIPNALTALDVLIPGTCPVSRVNGCAAEGATGLEIGGSGKVVEVNILVCPRHDEPYLSLLERVPNLFKKPLQHGGLT